MGRCVPLVVLLAITNARAESMNLLINAGFETPVSIPTQYPSMTGIWSHDVATIVTAQRGITPRTGQYALRFDFAGPLGPDAVRQSVDVLQLFDLTPYADEVASGLLVVRGSFYANRIEHDSQTDTAFGVLIAAYDGSVSTFSAIRDSPLSFVQSIIETDGDTATWQKVTAELLLPTSAKFVQFRVFAAENVFNDSSGIEFDGHYGDDATLTITTIPIPAVSFSGCAALLIMAAGSRSSYLCLRRKGNTCASG